VDERKLSGPGTINNEDTERQGRTPMDYRSMASGYIAMAHDRARLRSDKPTAQQCSASENFCRPSCAASMMPSLGVDAAKRITLVNGHSRRLVDCAPPKTPSEIRSATL